MNIYIASIKYITLLGIYCCVTVVLLSTSETACLSATNVNEGRYANCAGCHPFQLKMVSVGGGKHGTAVTCIDCHPQHPPKEENTNVSCLACHDDSPHYQVGNCQHCHSNPHKPIESLRDPSKPSKKECLSCHMAVGQQMETAPSRHDKLYCTRCHTRHKEIPSCLDCHAPHLQNQSKTDCLRCHPAHQPLQIEIAGYVSAAFCTICHKREAHNLANTKTNHGALNCVYCHSGRHPSSPNCQDCHGLPHGQSIHGRHRKCLDCHDDAHALISND